MVQREQHSILSALDLPERTDRNKNYYIGKMREPRVKGGGLQETIVPFAHNVATRGVNTNRRFFMTVRCVRVAVGQLPPDRELSAPRSRLFFWRVKFLRLDGATLTDAPAEEIVPRDVPGRACAIVCMKNQCDVP